MLTVTFTPSEAGDAIVKIFTGTGSTGAIKTINQSVTAAGQTSVTWDGMTDAGPMVSPGTYTARVYYADKVANKATAYPVSGQFTVGGVTSIAVTSPTAGSTYAPGAALPVHWTPDFAASSGQFSIWVVSSQSEFYGGDIVAADGSVSYTGNPTLTAPVGTGYSVRVYYRSTPAASWTLYGQSAGTFTISAGFTAITVTAPTGTSSKTQGASLPVTWTTDHAVASGEFGIWVVDHRRGWYGGKIVGRDRRQPSYDDERQPRTCRSASGYTIFVYYRATSGEPWGIYGLRAGHGRRDGARLQRDLRHRPHRRRAARPRAAALAVSWTTNQAVASGRVRHLGGRHRRRLVRRQDRGRDGASTSYDDSVNLERAGRQRLQRLRLLPRHAPATPGASTATRRARST